MGLGDLVRRAADAVVQAALVSYYFGYYLVKGQNEEGVNPQQQLCIDTNTKPMRPPYSSPTMGAANTNVCCLHGVQTKPAPFGQPPPPPPPIASKPGAPPAAEKSGWFSWLNPKNWFSSSKPEEKRQTVQETPIPPPRHIKPLGAFDQVPNGASASDSRPQDQDQQSWLGKAMGLLPTFGKKNEEQDDETSHSPVINAPRRILRVVQTSGTDDRAQTDFIQELRHAVEPHYPGTFSHEESSFRSNVVRSTGEYSPPAPPAPPQTKVAPASIQIHVKPKQISSIVKPDDAWVTTPSGPPEIRQVPPIWSPAAIQPQPQPHAASTYQVQMQRQQLRKTTTSTESRSPISPVPYEPEDNQKSVRDLKRQWPPPSNATGVEIVKDLVFPSGAPGDLSSAIVADGDASFNYDAYRPTSRAEEANTRTVFNERSIREYSGDQEYPAPLRDAKSPEKYRELSQELTSKTSAGKGVEMFVRRRQKVENWLNEEEQRPVVPSSVQRMVPTAAPRKRVSANEVVDSVVEAASRKEYQWQPEPIAPAPLARPEVSSPFRRELERVASPTPAPPSWQRHERFFSPQPFNTGQTPSRERLFTPPPRTHEPKVQQQAYRSMSVLGDRMEQKEFVDWKTGPDMTTTVVASSTPSASRTMTTSTYAATRGSQYTKTSTYNTLPRTWKSYSEAYRQAR